MATQEEITRAAAMLKAFSYTGDGAMGCALLPMTMEGLGLPIPSSAVLNWINGPVVVHVAAGFGLEDSPMRSRPEYRQAIHRERIDIAMGLSPLPLGPTEWAMVAYGATMAAPMQFHFVEVYLWASSEALRASPLDGRDVEEIISSSYGGPASGQRRLTQDDILNDPCYSDIYTRLAISVRAKAADYSSSARRAVRKVAGDGNFVAEHFAEAAMLAAA